MRPTLRLVRLAAWPVVFVFAALAGCDSKSDSNPAGGNTLTQDDISVSASGALHFVTQFLSEIRPLTQGDFSNLTVDFNGTPATYGDSRLPAEAPLRLGGPDRAQGEVVWSEPDQSWVLDATQTDTTPDGTATFEVHVAVQYLTSGGAPQQMPDGQTGSMTLDVTMSADMHSESQGDVFDLSLDYVLGMTVSGMPDGPYPVDGGGTMDMSLAVSGPSAGSGQAAIGLDWLMDVTVPADGSCPDGLVTMNAQATDTNPFTFVGTYDGSPTYAWTLYENGVQVDSGTEIMACGTPAP